MVNSGGVAIVARRLRFPVIWPPRVETRPAVVVVEEREEVDEWQQSED